VGIPGNFEDFKIAVFMDSDPSALLKNLSCSNLLLREYHWTQAVGLCSLYTH